MGFNLENGCVIDGIHVALVGLLIVGRRSEEPETVFVAQIGQL
jgi:hypothetical protein